jgi:hypothetical protein
VSERIPDFISSNNGSVKVPLYVEIATHPSSPPPHNCFSDVHKETRVKEKLPPIQCCRQSNMNITLRRHLTEKVELQGDPEILRPSCLPNGDHYDSVSTAAANVQPNAEPSYGIYIYFNCVIQLYSRGAPVINEAQPGHILDTSLTSGSRFWRRISPCRAPDVELVVVWASADHYMLSLSSGD